MSRERILAVAARLFAAGGFEATSMRDIAGPSGLLAGSIYHHFHSKNDLVEAVYRAGVAEIAGAVDRALMSVRGLGRVSKRRLLPTSKPCWPIRCTPR